MACRCSAETLKASLLVGSILTWTLGIVIFGLSLSTIKKPVFTPKLVPLVSTVYASMVVALTGAVFICIVALLGCCGAACKKPSLLVAYASGLIILFVYQMVDGISLLYERDENFPYVQFLSVDLCQYRKQPNRSRQGRNLSPDDLIESITRAEANAREFNRNVALLLEKQKAEGKAVDCSPIKDLLSPTAALLFLASALYIYLCFCSVKLAQMLWVKREKPPCSRRLTYKAQRELEASLCESQSPAVSAKSKSSWSLAEIFLQSSSTPGSAAKYKADKSSPRTLKSPTNRLSPRNPSTASSANLYSTPPMYFLPSIVLCPPTP